MKVPRLSCHHCQPKPGLDDCACSDALPVTPGEAELDRSAALAAWLNSTGSSNRRASHPTQLLPRGFPGSGYMDPSGYWPTLASIIFGLGLADLLGNLHRLIDARRRLRWDPLPLLWAATVLLWLFNAWWAMATNLDGSQNARTVAHFVLLAIPPIVWFLMAASVLPRDLPAEGRFDMRLDWTERRAVFLALFALNQTVTWASVMVRRHSIPWDAVSLARTVTLLLLLLTLFQRSRRLEWIAVITIATMVIARLSFQDVR